MVLTKLMKHLNSKREFNPNSKEDLRVFKTWIETRSWGNEGCPFEIEWPWNSVPDMIQYKIAEAAVARIR